MVDSEKIKALVLRAQDGDGDAFNELYNISCHMLRAVGMKYLHNPDDVSEILQDTYLRIHRSFIGDGIAPLREPEKFLPWSKKIMENLCKNLLDSRKRKPEDLRPETSDETQAGMDVFDNSDDDRDFSPEDAIETNYIRSLLEQKMSHVSPERQTCFALHQQGLTYREIAEQLSIPEGTVKSHVRYFRQQLQKTLKAIEKEENIQFHGIVPLPLPDGTIRYLVELEQKQPAHWIAAEQGTKPESKAKAPKTGIGRRVLWISLSVALVAAAVVASLLRAPLKANIPTTTRTRPSYTVEERQGNSRALLSSQTSPAARAVAPQVDSAAPMDFSDEAVGGSEQDYAELNGYRTQEGVSYWDSNSNSRRVFNTNEQNQLLPLSRSILLENIAKDYVKKLSQNSNDDSMDVENTGLNTSVQMAVIKDGSTVFKDVLEVIADSPDTFDGSGRNDLLSSDFDQVGIASYKSSNGPTYWAIVLGG